MLDLLPFGFGSTMMIVARLGRCTRLVRRAHVVGLVRASQFQRPNVLDDPALANTINASLAEHTDPFGPFPNGKPHSWREPRPLGRPEF
nr:hypothetical protein [Microvirga soli]